MIELSELKSFVRMHEHKLRAKVNTLEANRLGSKLHNGRSKDMGYNYDEKYNDNESRYYYRVQDGWQLSRDALQDYEDDDYGKKFTHYLLIRR